jgi:hypothetical protein
MASEASEELESMKRRSGANTDRVREFKREAENGAIDRELQHVK